ncbi:MAG TPA: LysM domain-containing protein, partial [Candidatus Limnocylindrales bacterium]|nr:LysM domain-containing protein [Candidatus Limnocylindrales bacterium]
AFPVCPTFQDWARREAARARTADLPPAESDEDDEGGPPIVDDRPPRRGSRGTWAAPPPWLSGAGSGPTAAPPPRSSGGQDADSGPAAGTAAGGMVGGLAGSFADRLASDQAGAGGREASAGSAQGSQPADRSREPDQGPGDDEPEPRYDERPRYAEERAHDLDEAADEDEAMAAAPRLRRRERLEAGSDRMAPERDIGAPSWERPRRLEAYPTLRSRAWSSAALPSIALGLLALLLAAAALFFLPQLLGLVGPGTVASPTPSVVPASVAPSGGSVGPSELPTATPFLYTVKSGDTMFGIAKKFGVDFNALIAANKDKFPNPDKINAGDQIVIPAVAPSTIPGASG